MYVSSRTSGNKLNAECGGKKKGDKQNGTSLFKVH